MAITKLKYTELQQGLNSLTDTVWVVSLKEGCLEILKDSMTPELEGKLLDYSNLSDMYMQEYIYPADRERWKELLSLEALRKMAASECRTRTFDMRFCNDIFGFEWQETYIHIFTDEAGTPDRALLTSRNMNDYRKAQIVEAAVQTEYDYVVYIEADKNSYVMYTSNMESGTPVPPVASNDYENEVDEFHRRYVPEKERDNLTEKLRISNVLSALKQNREYILFCKVLENGVYRDKKLRFSYLDRERNIILLTRTDIMEVREEERQKQLLQDALQVATVASRAKSEFLSRMSHDIRTPMNAIIGMTAIAGMHLEDQERIADCLKKITVSSKLLLSLINEVLDMSKIESGHILLSEEAFDLGDLLQSLIVMVQTSVDQKHQDFKIHLKQVMHEKLVGDVQRIQQVLLNMLSNAIKYTQDHGEITLDITEKPLENKEYGLFEVTVTDNGIGMRPEFLAKLFEPFERADDAAIRNIQGTGLGMAISRNIANMMNGDIHVKSQYGKGSEFTVTMQLKLQQQEVLEEEALKDLPVLVADDDQISCETACMCIDEIGMKSEYVLSGAEAVVRVKEAHDRQDDYFAVIIDLMMPDMNGLETAANIRKCVGPDVPIIILSAYDYSLYEEEARRVGIDGFICKPLMKSKLFYLMKEFALKEETKATPDSINRFPLGNFTGKRLLIVEDNLLNREIAYELLSTTGAIIETAENGLEAVNKVQSSAIGYYDLVFMDIQMPVMDGYSSVKAIRSLHRPDAAGLPVIAMSANAFSEDVHKSKEAGMNGHIAKPIDLNKVREVMEKWLNRR